MGLWARLTAASVAGSCGGQRMTSEEAAKITYMLASNWDRPPWGERKMELWVGLLQEYPYQDGFAAVRWILEHQGGGHRPVWSDFRNAVAEVRSQKRRRAKAEWEEHERRAELTDRRGRVQRGVQVLSAVRQRIEHQPKEPAPAEEKALSIAHLIKSVKPVP